jgi:L-alanine-DL-glutamate epimerase-like enolase superfamily enzyme
MKSQPDFSVMIEETPFAGEGFKISREIKLVATTVKLTVTQDGLSGIGEGVPLKRYHHTAESVAAQLRDFCSQQPTLENLEQFPAGPARFALDTALTHLAAQQENKSIVEFLNIPQPVKPIATAFTLSVDTPEKMAAMAKDRLGFATLKLKLGGDNLNLERLAAIRAVAPQAQFILDANEALTPQGLDKLLSDLSPYPVILMEQPLPAGNDNALRDLQSSIPFAADESCHTIADLADLQGKYQVVNLKLDKTGGLHHALKMTETARAMGFEIMIGCMGSTSLSIYPAVLLAAMSGAKYNDLDGSLLLAHDPYGLVHYADGFVSLSL